MKLINVLQQEPWRCGLGWHPSPSEMRPLGASHTIDNSYLELKNMKFAQKFGKKLKFRPVLIRSRNRIFLIHSGEHSGYFFAPVNSRAN